MSYPKQLLQVRPRRGVASDIPAWTIPADALSQGDNVLFRQGFPERAPATQTVYDPPSVAPYMLQNYIIDGTNYWVYIGATASYAVTGSTHTDITHAGGQTSSTDASELSLINLNSVPVFNNGTEEPMYWDGNVANNFVDLPGWTSTHTCKVLVPHRYHLFAMDYDGGTRYPEQVKWSDSAPAGSVPSSWTPSASNEAGSTELADTPGGIISAASLGGSLVIYKTGSTYLADYIGGNEVFAFRPVFRQAGALTRHAVAEINGAHFVVTDGDIVIHDGQTIRSIAQDRRKRFLFNSLDQDNYQKLFVAFNKQANEVWLCFPESGQSQCTRAMVYDISHDAWGDRELPGVAFAASGIVSDATPDETWDSDSDTWDVDSSVWNAVAWSASEEALVLANPTDTEFNELDAGSELLTSTVAKADIDFGEPGRLKFVRRVHLRIEGATGIDFAVRVGSRNSTGDAVTWQTPVTVNSDDGFANVLVVGKYISVEVSATTASEWKLTGLDLEAEMRGYY